MKAPENLRAKNTRRTNVRSRTGKLSTGSEIVVDLDSRRSTRRSAQVTCGNAQLGGVVRSTPPTDASAKTYPHPLLESIMRHPSNWQN